MKHVIFTYAIAMVLGSFLSGCAGGARRPAGPLKTCTVEVKADGSVMILGEKTSAAGVSSRLKQVGATPQTVVVIKADPKVEYATVRRVIDKVVGFGCTRVQYSTR